MYKKYSIKRFIRGNDSDVYQYKNALVKKSVPYRLILLSFKQFILILNQISLYNMYLFDIKNNACNSNTRRSRIRALLLLILKIIN